jgi:hypothetical protein
MHWVTKLAKWLRLPEPYVHMDGWVFDGKRVFADTFCQAHGGPDRHHNIPAAGSDWWFSYRTNRAHHRKEIFDSQREAVDDALEKLDRRIAGLQLVRKQVLHRWRGHLKSVP